MTDSADAAVYLVRFGDGAALIDAGTGRAHTRLRQNIDACLEPKVKLEYILLTHSHFDHTAGSPALREAYGCPIVAHELDAVYLESGDDRVTGASLYAASIEPFTVDIKLTDPESTITVGNGTITAVHVPGHSPGSLVYTTEIDGLFVLFGQDVHGPILSDLLSDDKKYLESLKKLENMNADLLLEGHFGIFEGKEEVRAFIRSCENPTIQACRC